MDFDLNVDAAEKDLEALIEFVANGGDTTTEEFETRVSDAIHKMFPGEYSLMKPFIPAALKVAVKELSFGLDAFFGGILELVESESLKSHAARFREIKASGRFHAFTAYQNAGFTAKQAMELILVEASRPDPYAAAVRNGLQGASRRSSN